MDKDLFFDKFLKFRDEFRCEIHHARQANCEFCTIQKAFTYIYQEAITENWGE